MDDERCVECERLPVKSRRNSVCLTCEEIVCWKCQGWHWETWHEAGDYERMQRMGIVR